MSKTVLITGTSSGYGKETAQFFLDKGWNVVATMRRPDASLFPTSERLKVLPLDVTNEQSIKDAIVGAVDTFGAIDVWVNNAGIALASIIEITPDSVIRELFDTNTFGVISACRAIIPQMRKQGHGVIINVTSSVTIGIMPIVAIYAASKCAVEGFTESLSYELAHFNIKARLVEPGYAPTTAFSANGGPRMEGLLAEDYGSFIQGAFGRMANYPTAFCAESEVAEAVYKAATDEGSQLRYLAGADTKLLAGLRWSTSEEEYQQKMHEMFAPQTA
jgi:NAD(P)-dependent dehydrogenase (short-subunit alcohol dehydrogenase family)